ncbi:MAG TPA: hypothetical protein PLP01_00085 [Phycisphaerae bacterium]|nr:hypothetical protein [Phycisphaerae bacterium]
MARWRAIGLFLPAWILPALLGWAAGSARADDGRDSSPTPETAIGRPGEVLRAFFTEQDVQKRALLARQFAEVAPPQWPVVIQMLHRTAPFPSLAPKTHALETPADGDAPGVRYLMRIPPAYRHDAGVAWPVVIGCHGTGGSAGGFMDYVEVMLGPDADKYVIVCPEAPTVGVYRPEASMIDYPLRVLDDVRRRVNVDSNRTVLTGYSKGGYTTWGTVLFSPGQWGGAAPMAAWPMTEAGTAGTTFYLENVLHLAVQAHWGEHDILPGQTQGINTLSRQADDGMKALGAARYEGIQYAGQGHQIDLDGPRVRGFIAGARRDPFPARFRMVFHRVSLGRAWYVRAVTGSKPDFNFAARQTLRADKPMDAQEARRMILEREAFEINVTADAGKNSLDIRATNLREIEMELSPLRMDFGRAMTVKANGLKLLDGTQAVDWVELLETARRTCDFERLVGLRLRRGIPPKAR